MSPEPRGGGEPGTEAGRHLLSELPDAAGAYDGTSIHDHVLLIEAEACQQGRDPEPEEFRRLVIAVLTENQWGVYEAGTHVWVDRRRFADLLRAALSEQGTR